MPDSAIAETVTAASDGVGTIVGAGGGITIVLGIFGWLFRRVFGHTIPRLVTTFEKTVGELRTEMQEQRRSFEARMDRCEERAADDRKLYLEQISKLVSEVRRG